VKRWPRSLQTRASSRDTNTVNATQAQTVIAAAILRHPHAVITTGQASDPAIATHGTRQVLPAVRCLTRRSGERYAHKDTR
jgi:hypothetical protein